eukprot:g3232.t1
MVWLWELQQCDFHDLKRDGVPTSARDLYRWKAGPGKYASCTLTAGGHTITVEDQAGGSFVGCGGHWPVKICFDGKCHIWGYDGQGYLQMKLTYDSICIGNRCFPWPNRNSFAPQVASAWNGNALPMAQASFHGSNLSAPSAPMLAPASQALLNYFNNGNDLLTNANGASVRAADALVGKSVVAVYFSAHWCGPCRYFTPQLAKFYQSAKQNGFEVIFASFDNNKSSFQDYLRGMPWLALTWDQGREACRRLSSQFNIRGYPTLVVLDGNGNVVSTDAVSTIRSGSTSPEQQVMAWAGQGMMSSAFW